MDNLQKCAKINAIFTSTNSSILICGQENVCFLPKIVIFFFASENYFLSPIYYFKRIVNFTQMTPVDILLSYCIHRICSEIFREYLTGLAK